MDSWKNIIGHSSKIDWLKKSIADKKFPHAVIFSGVEGIGKKKVAEICASSILCEENSGGEPCGVCPSCRLMAAGSHPDFHLVAPEETKTTRNIKIAQIRSIQNEAALKPLQSANRVVVIDGAEFMNNPAANCLLKTLEEPPSQTIFILITANRAGLLMTMRSRCVTVNFEKLTAEQIKSALLQNEIDSSQAEKISLISGGSLGRAMSLAKSGGYELRETALDLIERVCLKKFTNEDIFSKGAQISEWSREQFFDFVTYIQKILRDVFLIGQAKLFNPDLEERLGEIKISDAQIFKMIDAGNETQRRIKSNASLRLLAEAYFLRLKMTARKL